MLFTFQSEPPGLTSSLLQSVGCGDDSLSAAHHRWAEILESAAGGGDALHSASLGHFPAPCTAQSSSKLQGKMWCREVLWDIQHGHDNAIPHSVFILPVTPVWSLHNQVSFWQEELEGSTNPAAKPGMLWVPGLQPQGGGCGITARGSELRVQRNAPSGAQRAAPSLPPSLPVPPCSAVPWAERGLQAAIRHEALMNTNLWPAVCLNAEPDPQVQQTDVLPAARFHSRCLRWISQQHCRPRPVGLLGLAG